MITYIWKQAPGYYIEFNEEIDPIYWEGQIGETLDDFYAGKWVKLSNEQVAFHNEHENASLSEMFNMELTITTEPDPIELAKNNKLRDLEIYDRGSNINDFTVNGEMHAWFIPEMRSNYRNSIDAAKLLGVESLDIFIGDTLVTIPTASAEQMLAAIQLYADQCFIKTKQHEAAIKALNTVEDINNYDYTVGYPTKLNFTL